MKWKYRLFPAGLDRVDHFIQQTLNNHGKDGWELVAVYESRFRVFVLKRPVGPMPSWNFGGTESARAYAPTAYS